MMFFYKFINISKLANSGNTNCHPFQVKINCSKFIMMDNNNVATMTLLISLFVISRNILLVVFLQRKIITILQKVAINFRQVLVRDLEYFGKVLQRYLQKS